MDKTCRNCANYDRKIGFAQICGKCHYDQYANDFEREPSEWKPGKHFTNADCIRAMSDEELKEFFCKKILLKLFGAKACYGKPPICPVAKRCNGYQNGVLDWLKAPYKENEE